MFTRAKFRFLISKGSDTTVENADHSDSVIAAVCEANAGGTPLRIVGGDTKSFYGRQPVGAPLSVALHRGVTYYDPAELVVSARAGTELSELCRILADQKQMLPFEPPGFGQGATVGGTVACGFSGPARPYRGSLRDYVLGVSVVNGQGEHLQFGGRVIKNVAGYDASRLMAGALGSLGVMLEISFKVLPLPEIECTVGFETSERDALRFMNEAAARPLPITGSYFCAGTLKLRLSGSKEGVSSATTELGGLVDSSASGFWTALVEHQHPYFSSPQPLWRLSVPATAGPLDLPGDSLIEWGGCQRWLRSELPAEHIRESVSAAGGHATLFRGGDQSSETFQPLGPVLHRLHLRLKQAFDPKGILNPGRLYPEL